MRERGVPEVPRQLQERPGPRGVVVRALGQPDVVAMGHDDDGPVRLGVRRPGRRRDGDEVDQFPGPTPGISAENV